MLYLISFLCFTGGTIYLAALPELGLLFHVPSALIKFSLTIFFIGLIFGNVLFAPLAEMYGRTWLLIFFLSLFSAASLLACFPISISWFLVARFLQGCGLAGGPIVAIALVADRYEGAEYHKYLAYVLLMIGVGGGIGPILGSLILHFLSWKAIFYFLTALGLVAIGLVLKMRRSISFAPRKLVEIRQEYGYFAKHPFFRIYCLLIGVLHGAIYVFMTLIPYIFRLHYGWSIIDFAWVGLAIAGSQSIGNILVKTFIEDVGSLKLLVLGLAIITLSFVLFILFHLPTHGIEFLLIAGLFAMGISVSVTCLIGDAEKVNPQFSGIASGFINLSKITFISLALVIVLFLPDTLEVIDLFIFGALVVCVLGYLKIRKAP